MGLQLGLLICYNFNLHAQGLGQILSLKKGYKMSFIKNFVNKIKYGEPVVITSGLPRSGTSMIMNMLSTGGLEILTDNLRTADDDNQKGYFEYEPVKNLHKMDDKSWVADYKGKGMKVISWLLKDLPEENFYKVVFIRRNLEEVLASQNKMLVNREESNETEDKKMIENYRKDLLRVKVMMNIKPNFDVLYVNHRDVIQNPMEEAKKINSFLGNKFDVNKMAGVVDKSLYRNRK